VVGKYICKICKKDLSLCHLNDNHKKGFSFVNSKGFEWILDISESFDFIGSLQNRNIDAFDSAEFIKTVYNEATNCRKFANLGQILKSKDNEVINSKKKCSSMIKINP